MTVEQSTLLMLVGSGLSGHPVSLPSLDAASWEAIYSLAKMHTVTGLLYRGLQLQPEGVTIPEDVLMRLISRIGKVSNHGKSMKNLTVALTDYFSGKGLHPVVMKGMETATYYPDPDLRLYGDVDIYFAPEEFDKAAVVAEKRFGKLRKDPDGSLHFKVDNIDIDLHRDYFGLHVAEDKLPAIGSPEGIILMHSGHILHHAIASGIGLRQMCDLAAAYQALEGKYNQEVLIEIYQKTGLLKWNRLLSSFIRKYLYINTPISSDASTKALENIIFEGGNFGHYAPSREKALKASSLRRKADTFGRMLRRLPFSLAISPRETVSTLSSLIKGNISR